MGENFGNPFDTTKPIGSDQANTLDTIIEAQTKKSLAERYALEHIPLNSGDTGATDKASANAQGRHVAGAVSVLLTGTLLQINAFADALIAAGTPPGTGAMALTDDGNLMWFNGSAFETMGLTATIYSAGDGLDLAAGEFSVDYATEDDIVAGTSTTKVPAVADLQWSYGLTQYMLMWTRYTASSPALVSGWNIVPLEAPDSNTVADSSVDTGANTFTLGPGLYELEAMTNVFMDNSSDANRSSCSVRLYNNTTAAVVAYSSAISIEGTGSSDSTGACGPMRLVTELSLAEETTFQLECNAAISSKQKAKYFEDTNIDATALAAGIPTHSLRIWKKKPVGA